MLIYKKDCFLAGVGHPTVDSVSVLLLVALHFAGVALLGARLWRGLPLGTRYFSSSFILALSPWLCCTLIGVIRLLKLGNIQYLDRPEDQIQPIRFIMLYGIVLSGVTILIYSFAQRLAGRRLSVEPGTPTIDVGSA